MNESIKKKREQNTGMIWGREVWDDLSPMGLLYLVSHASKILGMMYCDSPPQISCHMMRQIQGVWYIISKTTQFCF
jgi:hypothetical protein